MTADLEDLDDLVRRHDPDRWLASRFIGDVQARADVVALYAFDFELSRIPQAASNPLMVEIRLTWWSEALDEIYDGKPVRKHPVTLALASLIARHSPPRDRFEAMLDPRFADPSVLPAAPVMQLAAFILGGDWPRIDNAAQAWLESDPTLLPSANDDLKALPAAVFPAVAYATLARLPSGASPLRRRLALTWAVLQGRL